MDKQIVYVLVSSEKDYYYEEAYLSAYSVKKHNPDIKIILLIDNITKDGMKGFRSKIMEYVDDVVVHQFDDDVNMYDRSRYLKTNMRFLIKGDFLYIDVDTIIAGDLSEVFEIKADIAAIYDRHAVFEKNSDKKTILKSLYDIGYHEPINGEYFNGGVLYSRDTERAKEFFKFWFQYYKNERKVSKYKKDQFALSEANYRMNGIIKELNGKYNCQMDRGVKYLADSRVIHYIGLLDNEHPKGIEFDYLMFELANIKYFKKFREKEKITEDILEIVNNPRSAIRDVVTVPTDSNVYKLICSNNFLVQMIVYNRLNGLYRFNEKILSIIKKVIRR